MRHVRLSNGKLVPAMGLGTWRMGERKSERPAEVAALRLGLDLGLALIDTAEMYGEGGAEEVVAQAINGRRDKVFLVSKVYPHNASRQGAIAACERSLQRLRVDQLDLYLLHWRGGIPLGETVEAFETLKSSGKIADWGVSNFDTDDTRELETLAQPGACVANQVLYHPGSRGIEWELLPYCRQHQVAVMAYSPLGQGGVVRNRALLALATKHGVSPAAIALAWVLRNENVIAIPKASHLGHVRENAAAADLVLDAADLGELDKAFAPPKGAKPLAIL